jgi:hypothetical protein
MVLECSRGQPDDGRSVEMIVAPMTLREWRRHERAAFGEGEMGRFGGHPNIVAQAESARCYARR